MRFLLLFVAALAALFAPAALAGDLVVRNQERGLELRLHDTPCSHGETLAHLKDEWRPKFRNAKIVNRSGTVEAFGCWIAEADAVVLIWEDGSNMALPMAAFSDPSV